MAINLGSTNINSIYLGSTEVVKVYLGATEVYSKDVGTWTPADFSGKVAWWDASDTGTITESSGFVSQVDDKFNSYDLLQGNASFQPTTGVRTINSKNVITFSSTGAGQHLQGNYSPLFDVTNSESCIIVIGAKDISGSVNDVFLGGEQSGGSDSLTIGQSGVNFRFRSGSGNVTSSGDDEDPHVFVGIRDASGNIEFIIDGVSIGTASTTDRTLVNFTVGGINETGDDDLEGCVGEIITLSAIPADSELNQMGAYMTAKWGTPWTDI